MTSELDRQLRAFGATLQHHVGEPLSPSPRRRWRVALTAAAAVAVIVGGTIWLVGGDSRTSVVTTADTTIENMTTAPATTTTVVTTVPDDERIDGRTVRFPGCPALAVGALPPGWGEGFGPIDEPGVGAVRLAGPNETAVAVSTTLDQPRGQLSEVDGYWALASPGTVAISATRAECPWIVLDVTDLEPDDTAAFLAAIELDDRALTDVATPPSITGPAGTPTLFGRGLFETVRADPYIETVSAAFGQPASDTGWLPTPGDFRDGCTDAAEYRSVFWGDLRVVFERDGANEALTAWSIGDQRVQIVAPIDPYVPTSSLGLTTAEGVAVGADVGVLEQFPMVGSPAPGEDTYFIQQAAVVPVATTDGRITGFGTGRTDCS
jgi:hypothetical protein